MIGQMQLSPPALLSLFPPDQGCAWCHQEQGILFTEGTHGICLRHAAQIREAQRLRHARLAQERTRQTFEREVQA